MYTESERQAISRLIRKLGIIPKYRGYYYVADAAMMYLETVKAQEAVMITKEIYPTVARKYKVTVASVERSIRTVVQVSWETNAELLQDVAGYPLSHKPTNCEFLDVLAYFASMNENND